MSLSKASAAAGLPPLVKETAEVTDPLPADGEDRATPSVNPSPNISSQMEAVKQSPESLSSLAQGAAPTPGTAASIGPVSEDQAPAPKIDAPTPKVGLPATIGSGAETSSTKPAQGRSIPRATEKPSIPPTRAATEPTMPKVRQPARSDAQGSTPGRVSPRSLGQAVGRFSLDGRRRPPQAQARKEGQHLGPPPRGGHQIAPRLGLARRRSRRPRSIGVCRTSRCRCYGQVVDGRHFGRLETGVCALHMEIQSRSRNPSLGDRTRADPPRRPCARRRGRSPVPSTPNNARSRHRRLIGGRAFVFGGYVFDCDGVVVKRTDESGGIGKA